VELAGVMCYNKNNGNYRRGYGREKGEDEI
jgi:hypothetical protein